MSDSTTAEKAPDAAQDAPQDDFKSYGDIVWGQFKKYKLSYYSLWGVVGLFLLAICAPILALNVPLYISVPATAATKVAPAGIYFPWFRALFDHGFFESGVDIFFNSLIFTLPATIAAWRLVLSKKFGGLEAQLYKEKRTKYVVGAFFFMMFAFIALYFAEFRQPYVDYIALAKHPDASSIFPPFRYSYRDVDLMAVQVAPDASHWLGTDNQGRDVLTRMIYGTRISLTIGILAVAIYTSIGMVVGGVGGFFGGKVDLVVLRLIEVMICFPTFFLILTLRGFVEQASVFHIMVIIGVTRWTGIARLVRGEFLRLKGQDFVQAAIALGFTRSRIIFRHMMPNALGPVLVSATFGVAGAILLEASLSFLGLGPTTAPSWGQILMVGRDTKANALIFAPGFAIFATVSLLNLVGEGIRDAIDPKMRK